VSTTALDAALVAAQEAKAAYRDGDGSKDGHRLAAVELRYQRWVARGGPDIERARLAVGKQHTNREVGALYARWLDETLEG
jgi:hypothetical protein